MMGAPSERRCWVCSTLLEACPPATPVCPTCTLWQGTDAAAIANAVPPARPGTEAVVRLPAWRSWATRLRLVRPGPGSAAGSWGYTPVAAEMLAQRRGWRVRRLRTSAPGPWGWIWPWWGGASLELQLEATDPRPVRRGVLGLAIICRPADAEAVGAIVDACAAALSEVAVVVDSADRREARAVAAAIESARPGSIRRPDLEVIAHPLGDDFAQQRNRAQARLSTPWTLVLDTDERPTRTLLDALGWLIPDCEAKGRVVCGLARRNYVDGALTASYPDFQFRLLRTRVRWTGAIHEVPEPCRRFGREVWCFPVSAIDHHLDRRRLALRRAAYERIAAGAGRTRGQVLLDRPFTPEAEAPLG